MPLREQIAQRIERDLNLVGAALGPGDLLAAADVALAVRDEAVAAERLRLHTQLRDQITALDVWPKWPGEPERVPPPDEAMVGRADVLALLRGTTDA